MWIDQGTTGAWDPRFLRPFNDGELEAVQAFIGLTDNRVVSPLVKDKLTWKGDVSECFTVKAYCNYLEDAALS